MGVQRWRWIPAAKVQIPDLVRGPTFDGQIVEGRVYAITELAADGGWEIEIEEVHRSDRRRRCIEVGPDDHVEVMRGPVVNGEPEPTRVG